MFGPSRLLNELKPLDLIPLVIGVEDRFGYIVHVALKISTSRHRKPQELDPSGDLALREGRTLGYPNARNVIDKGSQCLCWIALGSDPGKKTPCVNKDSVTCGRTQDRDTSFQSAPEVVYLLDSARYIQSGPEDFCERDAHIL